MKLKNALLLSVAGMALMAGSVMADEQAAAATTPAAAPKAAAPKGESPNVTAMKAALALAEAGKFDEAIAAYEKMGVMKSKKMEGWRLNNEGLAYLQAEKNDKAQPLFEKATETDPSNYVAWNNLGTTLENAGDLDKAKEAYQKAIDAAKEAGASSAKAEGNLEALQGRLDRAAAKKEKAAAKAAAKATPAASTASK
jgi:tetratricopeptide (TPR) repeat protein